MDGYIIGSGAMLTAGPKASIRAAALHAQTDPTLASRAIAVAVDFEGAGQAELTQLLLVAVGWDAKRFESDVVRPLLTLGMATTADVLTQLARSTGMVRIDLFAGWAPDASLTEALAEHDIELIAHPLEAIASAALITSEKYKRWPSMQAA
jgi:hypothetical protein